MTDFSLTRYVDLLSELFLELAKVDVRAVKRSDDAKTTLLAECEALQRRRNAVIHRGEAATKEDATFAQSVSEAVFERVVKRMLQALSLTVIEFGWIVSWPYSRSEIERLFNNLSPEEAALLRSLPPEGDQQEPSKQQLKGSPSAG